MRTRYKNRIIGLSLILFSLISFKSFGQFLDIVNNNIHYEIAIDQAYYNGFGDVSSQSEIAMLIETTQPGDNGWYDANCWLWNCENEPCTYTFSNPNNYLQYAFAQPYDATFDLRMDAMEDDNATPCALDDGDDDYFQGFAVWNDVPEGPTRASIVFDNNNVQRWSSTWMVGHNADDNNWIFPYVSEWDLKIKTAWRFSAGDVCGNPLSFGVLGSNQTRTTFNSTSQDLVGNYSGLSALVYTNSIDNSSADVFYSFQIDQTLEVDISTISGNTNFDTYLRLYNQNCSDLIALNDDIPGTQNQSQIVETLGPGNYVVQVEGYNTANGRFQLQIQTGDVLVSTENSNKPEKIAVYPNPTSDLIQIDLDDSYGENGVIKIFDITGKLLIQETTNGQNKAIVPVNALSNGTYQVLIQSDLKIAQSKFVVQR